MRILLVVCLLLVSVTVEAAPAVIGTPVFSNSGASIASSLTVAATCPSGNSNVIALACVNTHKATTTAVTITGLTWNGVAMSTVAAAAIDTASNGSYAQMWILQNPTCDSASHNLVITLNTTNLFLTGGILFLKDVDLTDVHDTVATAFSATGAPTVDVDSDVGDLVVDCVAARNSNADLAAGAGQTGLVSQTTNATGSNNEEGGQSYEAGAASVTMSWTVAGSTPSWAIMGVSFNPAVTARRRMIPPRYMRFFDWLMPREAWANRE